MRKYNISANIVRTSEQLNELQVQSRRMAAFENSSEQLPPIPKQIMSDALEEHDGKVSIGGRNITNVRFVNDIDALVEEEQELEALVESLDKTCTRYKMDFSTEKTKLITNSAKGIQTDIKVKGQKLGTLTSFFR